MQPLVSESSHSALLAPGASRRANALLQQACAASGSLDLKGVSFTWRMLHLAQGLYATGDGFGAHVHDHVQVETILSGRFRFLDDAGDLLLGPAQVLLVVPHHAHSWCCMEPGFMMGGLLNVVGPEREGFLNAARETPGPLAGVGFPTCAVWARELVTLMTTPAPGTWRVEAIASLLRLQLSGLLNAWTDLSPWRPVESQRHFDTDVHARELCRHALEFLKANYAYPIQVQDVALQVGVSARHLSRLFRQTYGDSINHALNEIRLRVAHTMLQERNDLSVKEISYASGFARPAYFTACFRKAYSVRPSELRHGGP